MATGSRQKSRDTLIELKFRHELRKTGITHYRLHHKIQLPKWGKRFQWTTPDVALLSEKIAIYLDGCWFHGCPSCVKTRPGDWRRKQAQARARDQRHSRALEMMGWRVARFWEHDDPAAAARAMKAILDTEAEPGTYGLAE